MMDMMEQKAGTLVSRAAPWGRGAGWITDGFRIFAADWGVWLVITLVLIAISAVLQFVPLVGSIAVFVLMPIFLGGLMLSVDGHRRGKPLEVAGLFAAFHGRATGELAKVGMASLLLNLFALVLTVVFVALFAGADFLTRLARSEDMLAAGAELTFGIGLLIGLLIYVSLLMPITMLVWFAPALIVLEGEAAGSAMRHSFVGCLRNFGPYLVYGLVGLLLFPLLAIMTLGLGILVLVPVGIASIHAAYQDIFHRL